MNIILIGSGQIGSILAQQFASDILLHWKQDIDALDTETIRSFAPDAVINAAGKTDLKWCEENAREAFRSNVEAPVGLYRRLLAVSDRIRFLHFSSGCVWDGPYDENGKPFTPQHPPTPAAFYSWTKAACDNFLLGIDAHHTAILRPRQVFSGLHNERNTLVKLLRYPKLVDTPQSMTSDETIISTVQLLLTVDDWSGIWNIYDKGIITPYEAGCMLSDAGLRDAPQKITKAELDTFHKPKRVDTVLYDERFEKLISPPRLNDTLRNAIDRLKNSSADTA